MLDKCDNNSETYLTLVFANKDFPKFNRSAYTNIYDSDMYISIEIKRKNCRNQRLITDVKHLLQK